MKNAVYATISNIRNLPECWLYADHTYTYMDGHNRLSLPIVSGAHTSLLDELNIPYREKTNNVFEMWNPTCFETVEKNLPVYIRQGKEYRYINKHTGTIVSKETSKQAFELYVSTVKPQIDKAERLEKTKKIADYLSGIMNGAPAYGLKYTDKALLADCRDGMDIQVDGKNLKIYPVEILLSEEKLAKIRADLKAKNKDISNLTSNRPTDYIVVFDANKLSVGDVVEMKVPAGTEPIFVGRAGWQVKLWCSVFGLTKINVKPI